MTAPQTPLTAAIETDDGTTVEVGDVLGFPASGAFTIVIDDEWMRVTAGAGTLTWTVIRGYASTTADEHLITAPVILVPDGEWTSFTRVKGLTGAPTGDDAIVIDCVNVANAEVSRRVGMFLGPASDTVRLFDGRDATNVGRRLWVPGGIRTLTGVRLASVSGGTLTAATLSDFVLRPRASELRPGQPFTRVEIVDTSSHRFYSGHDNVELTGTFGPAAVPDVPARIADQSAVRMYQYRASGGDMPMPSASKFIYKDDVETLASFALETFMVEP